MATRDLSEAATGSSDEGEAHAKWLGNLARQRSKFLIWSVAIFGSSILFRMAAMNANIQSEDQLLTWQGAGALMTLAVKGLFAYRTVRLSRAMRDHWVQTTVYLVCSILPLVYLYPLIGLPLAATRRLAHARRADQGRAFTS